MLRSANSGLAGGEILVALGLRVNAMVAHTSTDAARPVYSPHAVRRAWVASVRSQVNADSPRPKCPPDAVAE